MAIRTTLSNKFNKNIAIDQMTKIYRIENDRAFNEAPPKKKEITKKYNTLNKTMDSNGRRSREVTEVGMLQPKVVGFGG